MTEKVDPCRSDLAPRRRFALAAPAERQVHPVEPRWLTIDDGGGQMQSGRAQR
jgi:hypothetical protein